MPKSRITTILLILILILAAVTRIGWPGLTEFKGDEAIPLRNAALLIREGQMPPVITSSVGGVPHPGLMAYLVAIPFAVVRDPAAVVIFFGLMGVVAVALTYWLGARYFGEITGLVAAALFAAAPWAIFYTRKLWAQNVPLFTLILMIGLYKLIVERKWWGIAPAVIMAVLLPGLYFGNVVFPVIVAISLALHWRAVIEAWRAASMRDRWVWSGVTVVGVLILAALMHQWIGGVISGEIALSEGAGGASGRFQPFANLWQVVKIATSYDFHSLTGDAYGLYEQFLPAPARLEPFDFLPVILMVAGLAGVIFRLSPLNQIPPEESARARDNLLLIWLFTPLIIWTLSLLEPQQHRYIGLYPAQFLLMGVYCGYLASQTPQPVQLRTAFIAGSLLLVIIVYWLADYSAVLRVVNTTVINGGHGAAAKWMWDAAREARRLAEPNDLPIVLNGTGDDPNTEQEATAFDVLLGDRVLWLIEGEAVTVNTPEGYVHLDTLPDGHYAVTVKETGNTSGEARARLANGIELLRVEPGGIQSMLMPGQNVVISVLWRVWGIPPTGDDFSYTIQLYDDQGTRYENINGHFLRTRHWRVGDVVITSGVLHIPAEAPSDAVYHLVVSLYHGAADGTIVPVGVLNADGGKIGEFVEIGLD